METDDSEQRQRHCQSLLPQLPESVWESLCFGAALLLLATGIILYWIPFKFTLALILFCAGFYLLAVPLLCFVGERVANDGIILVFCPRSTAGWLLNWLENRTLVDVFDAIRNFFIGKSSPPQSETQPFSLAPQSVDELIPFQKLDASARKNADLSLASIETQPSVSIAGATVSPLLTPMLVPLGASIREQTEEDCFSIIDLLLCELLPLHSYERGLILERLPKHTRDLLCSRGLLYWLPPWLRKLLVGGRMAPQMDRRRTAKRTTDWKQMRQTQGEENIKRMLDSIEEDSSAENDSSDFQTLDDTKEAAPSSDRLPKRRRSLLESDSESDEESRKMAVSSAKPCVIGKNGIGERKDESSGVVVVGGGSVEPLSGFSEVDALSVASGMSLKQYVYTHVLRYAPPPETEVRIVQRPVFSTVFDSRMSELAIRMMSYMWSKPFGNFNDAQLLSASGVASALFLLFMVHSAEFRENTTLSFLRNVRRLVFFVGLASFIELCLRESQSQRDTLVRKLMQHLYEHYLADAYTRLVNQYYRNRQQRALSMASANGSGNGSVNHSPHRSVSPRTESGAIHEDAHTRDSMVV